MSILYTYNFFLGNRTLSTIPAQPQHSSTWNHFPSVLLATLFSNVCTPLGPGYQSGLVNDKVTVHENCRCFRSSIKTSCEWVTYTLPSGNLTWQCKIHHLKMHFPIQDGEIFHCYVWKEATSHYHPQTLGPRRTRSFGSRTREAKELTKSAWSDNFLQIMYMYIYIQPNAFECLSANLWKSYHMGGKSMMATQNI